MRRLSESANLCRGLGIMAAVAVYLLAAVRFAPSRQRILVPADRPERISEPMRIETLNDSGQRGLRIPENAGRGWCGEAAGSATYTCYVPADGTYTLWAHSYWGEACTNAIYAQIDGSAKAVVGNDPIYGRWHWVRGPAWPLTSGTHVLTLSNHSDGIALTRLMLLNDPFDQPATDEPACFDLFYDGFDGCDGGNIGSWILPSTGWKLHEPNPRDFSRRVLYGKSEAGQPATTVFFGEYSWRNYSLNLRLMPLSSGTVSIVFGYGNPAASIEAEWIMAETGDTSTFRLLQRDSDRVIKPGTLMPGMEMNRWHDLSIELQNGLMRLHTDGKETGTFPCDRTLEGRIALSLKDGASAWFDDVHVRLTDWDSSRRTMDSLGGKGAGCAAKNCP